MSYLVALVFVGLVPSMSLKHGSHLSRNQPRTTSRQSVSHLNVNDVYDAKISHNLNSPHRFTGLLRYNHGAINTET
jgi:hypothetical protein